MLKTNLICNKDLLFENKSTCFLVIDKFNRFCYNLQPFYFHVIVYCMFKKVNKTVCPDRDMTNSSKRNLKVNLSKKFCYIIPINSNFNKIRSYI